MRRQVGSRFGVVKIIEDGTFVALLYKWKLQGSPSLVDYTIAIQRQAAQQIQGTSQLIIDALRCSRRRLRLTFASFATGIVILLDAVALRLIIPECAAQIRFMTLTARRGFDGLDPGL